MKLALFILFGALLGAPSFAADVAQAEDSQVKIIFTDEDCPIKSIANKLPAKAYVITKDGKRQTTCYGVNVEARIAGVYINKDSMYLVPANLIKPLEYL